MKLHIKQIRDIVKKPGVKIRYGLRISFPTLHIKKAAAIRPRRLIDVYTLTFVEFSDKDVVPDYTILSHRWMEGEEVTYQEFIKDQEQTRSKAGYQKILRACQWTLVMGGQYLWVDTCCIDNGNHDEIARNIRSMYAYYQNASFCYAYLADVRTHGDFTSSEWWERGWTLQELLAPPRVHFYDKKWRRIGSKYELRHEIAELTDIPQEVLSGQRSIHEVDVLERMSWTTGRETTKPQDRAYCLMGLLNVSLEPNYEEHVTKSFERLWAAFVRAHPEFRESLEFNQEEDELDSYRMLHEKLLGVKTRGIPVLRSGIGVPKNGL